jgi:hypothetical protein
MGAVLGSLSPEHEAFIRAQHVFFVATAPSGDAESGGHINLSPKGLDTFRILSPSRVAYLDLTGSGNETAAHVHQNGRLTIMLCAFEGKALILRLYGRGGVVTPADAAWAELAARFDPLPGARQIITLDITRVQTSCGWGVPLLTFAGDRDEMPKWAINKGEDGLREYREKKNRTSIDGIEAPRW